MKVLVNLTGEKSTGWLSESRRLAKSLRPILESVVRINQIYLATHNVPKLYSSGVRYRNEPVNVAVLGDVSGHSRVEEFACIPAIIERGWGDCDDLAPWRVAELRQAGEKARIFVSWRRYGQGRMFHVCVRRENGNVEDPSMKLGMR